MQYSAIFKRIIPFVLTFAAGLLLASFFVSITPNFKGWRNAERRGRCHRDKQQLQVENDRLREQYRSVLQQNEELRRQTTAWGSLDEIENAVPPVDLKEHHHPPKPPKRDPKHQFYGSSR